MYNAIYRKINETTIEEEWRKHNGDLELMRNIGEKGGYTCPYCDSKLMVRAGEKYDRHFAHRSGTSCSEAKVQEKQIKKYKQQKKREASTHKVICSFIYTELKGQESINEDVYVQQGVIAKAKEDWKYYPDLILAIKDREIAISVLTNVTPQKDVKLISSIQKQSEFYRQKGLDVVWFVEEREQTLNMHEHVIHLWASEVNLAIETVEDKEWSRFLETLMKGNHSVFNVFGYTPINQMDTKVKSLYYVSAKEERVTFTVNRLILDGKDEPYQGFVLNEGYDMRMATALSIRNLSLRLSSPKLEEQLRNDFQKQYETKLVTYIEKLKEKRRHEEQQRAERLRHEREKQEEHRKQSQGFQRTVSLSGSSFLEDKLQPIFNTSKSGPVYDCVTKEEAERLIKKIYARKITAREAKSLYFYMRANPSLRQKIVMRDFQSALGAITCVDIRKWLVEIEYM
jgi:DNA-directed RNA polymerase subunit RPC12/RpoP